jgi:hypothetical protein
MRTLSLFVPAPNRLQLIRSGSAIVGSDYAPGLTLIDYEGNVYDADALRTFEGRLIKAAGRHVQRYPTVARSVVDSRDLRTVGLAIELPSLAWVVTTIDNAGALADWLGAEPLPPLWGSPELRSREAARVARTLSPVQLARANSEASHQGRSVTDILFDRYCRS